ncbi:hypothetical protein Q4Q34_12455 [Flavivirga abyssicola]|uniref:hypothetical protein n=1 Tax=Flavivirga abyssicola TaxID=3063533 RepID=UPI0026DFE398|nr:hypothetical protein [Flavivirga sp. MEBiC07777]WVK12034.1 hypothetical protein Q4Q34_12455 [Flavivirga sp. MEBiC07777]
MNNFKVFKKNEFHTTIVFIIVIQIILSFQGFDVCDDGFALTFYQQIYNSPSSVEYNFVYWLSGIIGGVWYSLYQEGGVLWLRFLGVIINTLTFIVSYEALKGYISKRKLLIGLLIVLFVNDYGFLTFYHNHITALLAVLSIYFFSKGIKKTNFILLAIAGFLIGINVFSRIPNITLFVFILVIPFTWYLRNKIVFKTIFPPILGIVTGFIVVYITLYSLDQVNIMKNALFSLVSLGETEGSAHNVTSLFYTYVGNYMKLFFVFFQFLAISIFVLSIYLFFKKNRLIRMSISTLIFFLMIFWFKKADIYIIYVIGYIGTLGILFTKQKEGIKVLSFLAFLMMLFLPLGSGGGIRSSGYMCIWLAVPLFFYFISQFGNITLTFNIKKEDISRTITKSSIKYLSMFFLFSYATGKIYSLSQEAYFDQGSRLNKIYKINNKYASGVYTTKERALIINDLLASLEQYVKPNDYLLTYDKIPMVHFLTETKPYMFNPWIWIYDSYSFKKNMDRAEKEIDVLPIIVQQKFETIGTFSEPTLEYLTESIGNDIRYSNGFDKNRVKIMNSFISRNEYEIVWSNAYFNIYKSDKKR